MTYKDQLKQAMDFMAKDRKTVFIGYNVAFGSMAGGTLSDVPKEQLIETPVAENLMAGLALGMALDGWKPVVYIERCDFILNALDAIVNHADKIELMSDGEFKPKVIFRVVVGGRKNPLFTGPTHTQDFSSALRDLVRFPVNQLVAPRCVFDEYKTAFNGYDQSALMIEYRDLYNEQV